MDRVVDCASDGAGVEAGGGVNFGHWLPIDPRACAGRCYSPMGSMQDLASDSCWLEAGEIRGLGFTILSSHSNRSGAVMSKVGYRNIEEVPDRCGGRTVVAGTRIRVSVILGCHRQGMTAEQIVELYPHFRLGDVHDARICP